MNLSLCSSMQLRSQKRLVQCGIGSDQTEVEMDMDLTYQHTSLSVACDVPLSDPEEGGVVWGGGEQEGLGEGGVVELDGRSGINGRGG